MSWRKLPLVRRGRRPPRAVSEPFPPHEAFGRGGFGSGTRGAGRIRVVLIIRIGGLVPQCSVPLVSHLDFRHLKPNVADVLGEPSDQVIMLLQSVPRPLAARPRFSSKLLGREVLRAGADSKKQRGE